MKTSHAHFACRLAAVLWAAMMCAPMAQGAIYADFDAGNTTAEVDGWRGKAGDGWAEAWREYTWFNTTLSGNVVQDGDAGYSPLTADSGNYLFMTSKSTDSSARDTQIRREYENHGHVSLDAAHTVNYLFRFDSGLSDLDRVVLFDSNTHTASPTTTSAYYIRSHAGNWKYYPSEGGGSLTDSGVAIYEGDAYQFSIGLDPTTKTWDLSITNLDYAANERAGGVSAFSVEGLEFYGSAFYGATPRETVGGRLHFTPKLRAGSVTEREVTWSMDSIHIIPEPSTAALLLGMGAVLVLRKRRR